MRNKVKYNEAEQFAAPVEQSGCSLGLAARIAKSGTILGYFFGPRHSTLPSCEDAVNLRAEDIVLMRKFSDSTIVRGEWPLPGFGPINVADKREAYLRGYSEKNLNELTASILIAPAVARTLPEDGLSGHFALIMKLSILLPYPL